MKGYQELVTMGKELLKEYNDAVGMKEAYERQNRQDMVNNAEHRVCGFSNKIDELGWVSYKIFGVSYDEYMVAIHS